ncbi:MAG: discoidin domain-containing protein [Phycisphaerae bacterium]|nr:discoidin domain-containing protein [Phycisphaerae bacterium]
MKKIIGLSLILCLMLAGQGFAEVNLALSGTATASSEYSADWAAGKAIDNAPGTGWHSLAEDGLQWIEIALPEPSQFSKVQLVNRPSFYARANGMVVKLLDADSNELYVSDAISGSPSVFEFKMAGAGFENVSIIRVEKEITADSPLNIMEIRAIPTAQRAISVNYAQMTGGWAYHDHVSNSSVPFAGYDPNDLWGNWNEYSKPVPENDILYALKDNSGAATTALLDDNHDFLWHTSWYENVDGLFTGTAFEGNQYRANLARMVVEFTGHNGGSPKKLLTSVQRVPFGKYKVVTYMNPNRGPDDQELTVGDTTYYYKNENASEFKERLKTVSNPENLFFLATDTTGPASETANLAIFEDQMSPTCEIIFDGSANTGINAYQIISYESADDVCGNPTPATTAIAVPIAGELTWADPFNYAPAEYSLYVGAIDDPNWDLTPALTSTTAVNSYNPEPDFEYNTSYVWRVDTKDAAGVVHTGDLFYFDTEGDPVIQVQPRSIAVVLGGSTFLSVDAILADTYSWYTTPDQTADTPEDDVLVQTGNSSILHVTDVVAEDYTFYYCVLENEIPDSSPVPTDVVELKEGKLEAYYPFDGDPNDAEADWDAVSNATNTYVTGIVGDAISIDASDNWLTVTGSEEYFNFFTAGLTVNVWVQSNSYATSPGFLGIIGKLGGGGWYIDDLTKYYAGGVRGNVAPNTIEPGRKIDDGAWHMVTLTFDAASLTTTIYFDGIAVGTKGDKLPVASTEKVVIGAWSQTGSRAWGQLGGRMDEAKIYSYPLTPLEIANQYATLSGESFCMEPVPGDVNFDCTVNSADLAVLLSEWTSDGTGAPEGNVVSWQFDETSGSVATDSSGNGINGTLGSGFTSGQWQAGAGVTGDAADGALYMDGSANMSVIAANVDPNNLPNGAGNVFKGDSDWTINSWFKFDGTPGMVSLGGFGDCEWDEGTVGNPDRHFASWDNGLEFEISGDGFWPGTDLVGSGQWRMLTATHNATTGETKIFVDGAVVASGIKTLADCEEKAFKLNSNGWIIWATYAEQTWLKGWVDDYTVWDQAMTEVWVAAKYNGETLVSLKADFSADGKVDLEDFSVIANSWMTCNWVPQIECP